MSLIEHCKGNPAIYVKTNVLWPREFYTGIEIWVNNNKQ